MSRWRQMLYDQGYTPKGVERVELKMLRWLEVKAGYPIKVDPLLDVTIEALATDRPKEPEQPIAPPSPARDMRDSSTDVGCEHRVTDGACECARCMLCKAHVSVVLQHYRLRLERTQRELRDVLMNRGAGWMMFALLAGCWLSWVLLGRFFP